MWLETATDDETAHMNRTSNEEMLQVDPACFSEVGERVLEEVPRQTLDRVEHKARQNPMQENDGAHKREKEGRK